MSLSFWKDRPVLITGGTGLVGGWLANHLINLGANVVCLIRDWVPKSLLLSSKTASQITIVRGDIRELSIVSRIIQEYEINTVFHLAAQAIVNIAERDPLLTFETNVQGTWNILEACRSSTCIQQIVIASSDKAYGIQTELPYREDQSLLATHPYDVSKACGELIAKSYASTYQVPVAITRCGNFYGGGDLNWNRLIPGTIRSVLRNNPITIRSNGKLVRDYFYVEDGVNAYITLAEKMAKHPELIGEAFNFSNEEPLTVMEVVHQIFNVMETEVPIIIQGLADHEIPNQYLSSNKAQKILSWTPNFSTERGLQRTVEWYRDYLLQDEI